MALAAFWGMYPPGQWIVIILVISLVISTIGALQFASEGDGAESWRAFVIGPVVIVALLILITVLLAVISLCQWLWTLGVPA